MTFGRLLWRNLFFHWRGNLAVFLGVVVGTAVLTGALLVGDSLRGSLRERALQQLGWVDEALVAARFFRQELADAPDRLGVGRASPALLVQGSVSRAPANLEETTTPVIPRVTILGVRSDFWPTDAVPLDTAFWQGQDEAVVLNQALAHDLGGVQAGDRVKLRLQKASAVPRESLLGRRDVQDVIDTWTVTVRAVVGGSQLGNFNLRPSPTTPRNVFVPLGALQRELDQKGYVNALLVAQVQSPDSSTEGKQAWLQQHLHDRLDLPDWELKLRTPESRVDDLFAKLDQDHDGQLTEDEYRRHLAEYVVRTADTNHDHVLTRDELLTFYREQHGYLSLESRRLLLEPAVVTAAQQAAGSLRSAPTFVYLANSISAGKESIPYSIVAALDPSLPPPLGPFLPENVHELKDDQIVLADWPNSPLHVKPGDPITLTYFSPQEQGGLHEESHTFTLAGFVPLRGVAADPNLTPEFPGITDKLDMRQWKPPFPYNPERIKHGDVNDRFWQEYRTTPKAYVTLTAGQKLWSSRFGQVTSVRLAPASASAGQTAADLSKAAEDFSKRLLGDLHPEQGGLVFQPVREEGLKASSGFFDFGVLFLCFSCFLIAAALLLVGLLFRLNLDQRASEVGLLLATGFRRSSVRWLLLAEGGLLAVVAGLIGLAAAVLYAWGLLELLRAWWPGDLDRSFLSLHVTALSFVIGYVASLLVSVLTIAWAVFVLGRVSPRALLAGSTDTEGGLERRRPFWSLGMAVLAIPAAVACIVAGGRVSDPDMKAMTFFSSGALLLLAGLALIWAWMRRSQAGRVGGHGTLALGLLGIRNAGRHPVRSLLTAGLLASAAFLIVAVECFHRDPERDFYDKNGGSGGFTLLAETDVPIYQDLGSEQGRDQLHFDDAGQAALQGVPVASFRLRAGDDASCLNLYQPRRPRLLGVPHNLIERGGFRFQSTLAASSPAQDNPWHLLEQELPDGVIPVFGEANTVQYMLQKDIGQDLQVPDEDGHLRTLRVVGLLQDSVFQSELLMSDANFLRLYPHQEGFQFFLLAAPPERMDAVQTALQANLAPQGITITSTKKRLEGFLAAVNTYLSTFQALGGLGLLLGALGLAVVLLRSVWERRGELALLRALGFRQLALGWLVLAENGFLLALGLGVGTVAALLAVAPHLVAGTGEVPWLRLLGLLGLVLIVGLASAVGAVASTLQAPLVPALRRE